MSRRLLVLACLAALLSGCSSARPWKPRLVIVVSMDTCRADHLGCYGYGRATSPNVDRLAAEGVRFENAFSQSNESLFSYASIFSGLYPERIGPMNYDEFFLSERQVTMTSILQSYGFKTAAFVAGGNLNGAYGFGRGFDVYEDRWNYGSFFHTMPEAEKWLENLDGQSPALLFVQGYDAHAPYNKPLFYNELFDPGYRGAGHEIAVTKNASDNVYDGEYFPDFGPWTWFRLNSRNVRVLDTSVFSRLQGLKGKTRTIHLTPRDVAHVVAHYDGGIAYADVFVGELRRKIAALGLERETLLVLIGDHGEDLMEHGFFNHRSGVWDASVHVPLVMWAPGALPRGKVVKDVVQLLDVMPTVLDYAGVPPGTPVDGRTLRPLLERTPAPEPATAFAEGILPMVTVRTADARLICLSSSAEPLPPLDDERYRFLEIVDGRERLASVRDARAAGMRAQLEAWRASLQH